MKRVPAIAGRLADRINPIVVKELRQAVRSRYVVAIILLFLVASFFILFLPLFFNATNNYYAGRQVFSILATVLFWTGMLFVPVYGAVRLASERSETNVDLLFVTTIKPRQIVTGKTLSGVVILLLLFSVCAPYLMFSYLLRGIDIPSMLWILGIQFALCVLALQSGLFVASIPASRVFQILMGLGFVGGVVALAGSATGATMSILHFGGGMMPSGEFWTGVISFLVAALVVSLLFFVSTVSLLTPPMANRTWRLRVYLTCLWPFALAGSLVLVSIYKDAEPVYVWFVPTMIILSFMLWVSVSEKDAWTRRMQKYVPKSRILRAPFFLFYSTNAGGLLWNGLLAALTFGVMVFLVSNPRMIHAGNWFKKDVREGIEIMFGIWLYCLAYGLLAYNIRRRFLGRWFKPVHTFILAGILVAIFCAVPAILFTMLEVQGVTNIRYSHSFLQMGNPLTLFDTTSKFRNAHILVAGIAAAGQLFFLVPQIRDQIYNCRPLN